MNLQISKLDKTFAWKVVFKCFLENLWHIICFGIANCTCVIAISSMNSIYEYFCTFSTVGNKQISHVSGLLT